MEFAFVSGRLSLDYVGTLKWRRSLCEEQLLRPLALTVWARSAHLLDAPTNADRADLRAAVDLREASYRLVRAAIDGQSLPADALVIVNTSAREVPIELTLTADGVLHRRGSTRALLSTLARDALDLMGNDAVERVRECARPACTRLYLDTSRAQNRRWCGMSECGNYVKVTQFRRRASSRAIDSTGG